MKIHKNASQLETTVKSHHIKNQITGFIQLFRWDKPTGRIILLIPAGWSLWLTPSGAPSLELIALISLGGIFASGAGCIANDLWDREIDRNVSRTQKRPLASNKVGLYWAWSFLIIFLALCLLIVSLLPESSRNICLYLSIIALPIILIYPSSKRWFAYPQAILSICWGFAVLIPWAAKESSLSINIPLICCWLATVFWTFGFDTVYAMSDEEDDRKLGLKSSVLTLGKSAKSIVSLSYWITSIALAIGSYFARVEIIFWPFWLFFSWRMQKEVTKISNGNKSFGKHFTSQVILGSLMLIALILTRVFNNA